MNPLFVSALVVSLVAAIWDWRSHQIPNWLTLPVIAIAPFLHAALALRAGQPLSQACVAAAYSAGGALLCGAVPLIAFAQRAMGGGDVKLLIAIGALCRPISGLEAQLYAFFAAALIAPVFLAYEGELFRTLKATLATAANRILPAERRFEAANATHWFRMGPAIAFGTFVMVLMSFMHGRVP